LQPLCREFADMPVVSISDAQRRPVPQAGWVRTIHHGLPDRLLTPQPIEPTYLACLGRISPEKGIDRAIQIAQRCGLPLKIAAKVDKVDRDYFNEIIKPLIDSSHAEYIGEISDREKSEFLSGAIALLTPLDWPEPFGLVMIEAMACGTPVIAYDRGAVPEVVEDEVTGFVVEGEDSAVKAVAKVGKLSRIAVRKRFEERFTARRMAMDYLAAYQELIDAAEDGFALMQPPLDGRSRRGRVSANSSQTNANAEAAMDASP
jgi:glycosyltransferase involved in cell wall biosynthesis